MALGIGERQRRAPGVREYDPGIDIDVKPKPLYVVNQMPRGVCRKVRIELGGTRQAAAAISLVEEHDAID